MYRLASAIGLSHAATPPALSACAAVGATALDVLFVLSTLSVGGSERKIVQLAARLAGEGVRVGIACLNGPYTLENEIGEGVPLWKLGRRGKFSFSAARALRTIAMVQRPAVLIAVNLYPSLYVTLAAALTPPPRPRTVGLVNTSTFGSGKWRRRFYQVLLPLLDRTVHGSEAQRRLWLARDRPAWQRSTVIYNGVDLRRFTPIIARREASSVRRCCGIGPMGFVLGTVGRLAPEKNQAVLLAALAHLIAADVDAYLLIAGEGALHATLARRAEELGIARRVRLLGAVADVRPVLAALDVFVLPSVAVESFSNAALEAMAVARPVVLSDVGGAREMIDDGVEGFVVTCSEIETRLPALLATLAAEPERRRRMGEAARRRVEMSFSLASMDAGYRRLLDQDARGNRHG